MVESLDIDNMATEASLCLSGIKIELRDIPFLEDSKRKLITKTNNFYRKCAQDIEHLSEEQMKILEEKMRMREQQLSETQKINSVKLSGSEAKDTEEEELDEDDQE